MIDVIPYDPSRRGLWNELNAGARNGHFLFDRGYMEYHANRFSDASCIILHEDVPIAVFPANVTGDTIHSHQGLTFGGVVLTDSTKSARVLQILDALISHYRGLGAKKIIYKALPPIYHRRPAQEDLYALFRFGARLVRRDVTTSIDFRCPGTYSKRRLRGLRKAGNAGISVQASQRWRDYWHLLTDTLDSRHGVAPVHTIEEIELLASRFPEAIHLYVATLDERVVAGVVMYNTATVAHAQYIAVNDEGRLVGALDCLFDHMISKYQQTHRFFDFGISNEDGGRVLNEGLVSQKEEFGGSTMVHDVYELPLGAG
jgi:hypothetical protein